MPEWTAQGATVDLLMALPRPDGREGQAYAGYREFSLLALLLERMGVRRVRVPMALDDVRTGLTAAGWLPGRDRVYVHGGDPA
jgi:hypothetical protein